MAKVESFTLDHTKVKAPYVRLITVAVSYTHLTLPTICSV